MFSRLSARVCAVHVAHLVLYLLHPMLRQPLLQPAPGITCSSTILAPTYPHRDKRDSSPAAAVRGRAGSEQVYLFDPAGQRVLPGLLVHQTLKLITSSGNGLLP